MNIWGDRYYPTSIIKHLRQSGQILEIINVQRTGHILLSVSSIKIGRQQRDKNMEYMLFLQHLEFPLGGENKPCYTISRNNHKQ